MRKAGMGSYGSTVLHFGRYKDWEIEDIPNSYLEWLLEQDWFENRSEFDAIQDEMRYREEVGIDVGE